MSSLRPVYTFGHFRLDPSERLLIRKDSPVSLPPKAFDTLSFLVQNPGRLLLKDELLRAIWPNTFVEEVNLAQNISQIRRALSSPDDPTEFIETVPKCGYRFSSPVRVISGVPQPVTGRSPEFGGVPPISTTPAAAPFPRRWRRIWILLAPAAALLAFVLVLLRTGWPLSSFAGRPHPISSLVVLPLENVSGDPSQDALALGMTDLLVTDLADIRSIRIVSRTSGAYYKTHPKPAREIARELDVDAILEGSIVQSGDTLRLSAQLIDARNDRHIWAQTFEADVRDALPLQDDFARAVASALRVGLSPELHGAPAVSDPSVVQAYLRGTSLMDSPNLIDLVRSQSFFQEAINRDPNYAPAYASLARVYWTLLYRGTGAYPADTLRQMKAASDKALALDDNLAEAHAVRGLALVEMHNDWRGGDSEFRRALQLNPGASSTHLYYSIGFLSPLGRHQESIDSIQQALALEPLSPDYNCALAWVYFMARRYGDAEAQFQKTLSLYPDNGSARWGLMEVYEQQQKWPEASAAFQVVHSAAEPAVAPAKSPAHSANEYWRRRLEWSDRIVLELNDYTDAAIAYSRAGQHQKALDFLEKGINANDMRSKYLNVEPAFDPLRANPRFRRLVQRCRFPKS